MIIIIIYIYIYDYICIQHTIIYYIYICTNISTNVMIHGIPP